MSDILGALVPVFLLIVLGHLMRRREFLPDAFWPPAEKLTYYVTFPALLTANLAEARLEGLPVVPLAGAVAASVIVVYAAMLGLRRHLGVDGPAFTSMVQGVMRPNTYFGLAAAAALYGGPGVTLTAICIAAVVPLVNVLSVVAMVRYASGGEPGWRKMAVPVATNPLILSCLLGILLNVTGIGLPWGAGPLLKILGAAALPIGLLAVGAGIDLGALRHTGLRVMAVSGVKLMVLPAIAIALALGFGLEGLPLAIAALYAALPGSASSYVLARQMGGDASLMANIITAQTLLAALTFPLVLFLFG